MPVFQPGDAVSIDMSVIVNGESGGRDCPTARVRRCFAGADTVFLAGFLAGARRASIQDVLALARSGARHGGVAQGDEPVPQSLAAPARSQPSRAVRPVTPYQPETPRRSRHVRSRNLGSQRSAAEVPGPPRRRRAHPSTRRTTPLSGLRRPLTGRLTELALSVETAPMRPAAPDCLPCRPPRGIGGRQPSWR